MPQNAEMLSSLETQMQACSGHVEVAMEMSVQFKVNRHIQLQSIGQNELEPEPHIQDERLLSAQLYSAIQ